jgi:hypothetical protein
MEKKTMHKPKENLPLMDNVLTQKVPGIKLHVEEWGDLMVGFKSYPPLTDFAEVIKNLSSGGMCNCPHWGYVLKGSCRVGYADGTEERMQAGDMFYTPPGHTSLIFEEETELIEFSPTKGFKAELQKLVDNMAKAKAGS